MAAPSHRRGLVVTVSDPQKMGDGLQAYVSYKVSATVRGGVGWVGGCVALQVVCVCERSPLVPPPSTKLLPPPPATPPLPATATAPQFDEKPPGLDGTSFAVIRRFSDFVWLRGALREAVPWAIVPSLPEKQQLGRFNADFVDIRLRALQVRRWCARGVR
jgi:hypothetical protein